MGTPQELLAGRYRLLRRIGEGGMGVVWEACDELLQRPVAVKQLRTQVGVPEADAELAKLRAMREARITARLHHPNAVPVFDAVEHDDEPCLVMQYVPSRPLSELLRERGTLPIGQVARIGAEIAGALAAAHALDIVHRDVKPGNILIAADDGRAMLSDFGISHTLGDATITSAGMMHGTPAYLSPEVARGEDSTFASDVFSLGSTLYAAAEGRAPFGELPNSIAVLHRVAVGGFDAPQHSGPLGALLLQMMAAEADDRPSMGDVALRLEALGEENDADDASTRVLPLASPLDEETAMIPVERNGTALLPASAEQAPAGANDDALLVQDVAAGDAAPAAEEAATPADAPGADTTARLVVPLAPAPAPPPADADPGGSRGPRGPRRRRVVLGSLVAVVVLLIGGFGLFQALRPPSTAGALPSGSSSTAPARASTTPSTPASSSTPATSPSATPTPTPSVTPTPSPTATPTPSVTPSASATSATLTAASAVEAISRYYTLVPGDTGAAWPLLTAAYQTGHAGGRAAFDGFWAPIASVSATNVRSTGSGSVQATITYRFDSGRTEVDVTSYRLVAEGGIIKISSSSVVSSG